MIDFVPTVIMSAGAKGSDKQGENYAKEEGIPLEILKAKWGDVEGKSRFEIGCNRYGKYWKMAGYARNEDMVEHANVLILFLGW